MNAEPERHHPDDDKSPELIAVLAAIVRAESPDQAVEAVVEGLGELTTATLLYFDREAAGGYRLARSRNSGGNSIGNRDVNGAGVELARHLPGIVEPSHPDNERVDATLFTLNMPADDLGLSVRPLGPFAEIFTSGVAVVAPLQVGGQPLGAVVGVWPVSTIAGRYTREAVTIAHVCDIAAPTLHRLRAIARLRDRVAESETIRRLTDSVARTPSLVGALDTICRSAQLITGLDLVATASTTSDHVIWKSACGTSDPSFLDTRIEMPNEFLRGIMRRGQEVVMEDVRNHPVLEPRFMPIHSREELRSSVTAPVYVNARLRALVLFGSRRLREFSSDEVRTMHAIAGTVATAIAASEARMSDGNDT